MGFFFTENNLGNSVLVSQCEEQEYEQQSDKFLVRCKGSEGAENPLASLEHAQSSEAVLTKYKTNKSHCYLHFIYIINRDKINTIKTEKHDEL
jgi:hypothetical protein